MIEVADRPGPFVRMRLRGEILWTWAVAKARMRRIDIRPAVASLRRPRVTRPRPDLDVGQARWLAAMVERTLAPLPLDSRCLVQSLVVTRMLARRGGTSTLVIGVKPGEEFGAHAWVEVDGEPVMPGSGSFPRLTQL